MSFKNSLYSSLSEHEIRLCDTALKKFEEAESKYNKELIDFSRESQIYPLSCVRGEVPERSIWKTGGVVVKKQ